MNFTPTVVDDSVIDGTRNVAVTATVGGWTSGSGSIDIADNESRAITVTLASGAGNESVASVGGTLLLSAPVESATTFTLASSSSADATVLHQ